MKQAANEHFAVPHRQRKSWITQDTLLLVERKRKAKASRLKSDDAMAEYTELCKRVKKSARRDKRMWIQQQCTLIEENHTEGKEQEVYRLVKQLTGSFQGSSVKMVKDGPVH